MHLLLQEILVLWTKAARTEPLASQLSKVTNATTLPPLQMSQGSVLKHRLVFNESSNFCVPEESWEELPIINAVQQGCVSVQRLTAAEWEIVYEHNVACGGLPQRSGGPLRRTLAIEQWGRVHYSGRVPNREQVLWLYCSRTINIGQVTFPGPRLFLDVAPAWVIDDNPPIF